VARSRGGTGWALEAAAHGSGNVVFVAQVPRDLCLAVELALIWEHREALPYNNQGKRVQPARPFDLEHEGDVPTGWPSR
jgi:hypothetical protein